MDKRIKSHHLKVNYVKSVFLLVLNLKITYKSTNMDVINAAILEYFNIFNPGPWEQEPGRGLTVLPYEYFYDG